MFRKQIEFWKIKNRLHKKLVKSFGFKKNYSLDNVLESCDMRKINKNFYVYAIASYSTASDFYMYLSKQNLVGRYKYKELRRELGLERINVDDDYSNPTGIAPM